MPDSLKDLTEALEFMPGVGKKTAQRFAFSIMDLSDEKIEFLKNSIEAVHSKIHLCPICNHLTELEICSICSDKNRNSDILCVVEDVKNVILFENLGVFRGYYHVLNGLISPIDGVNPEDIELEGLLDHIKNGNFKEIILAFKPGVEGETTALYIKEILGEMNLTISRIASGIPMGADMEYMDNMTLERALIDRRNLE